MSSPPRETVVFNGVTYSRYPDSPRLSDARYFKAGARGSLHRAVWRHHHGSIPVGHDIHHIDGDPGNNDIGNLEAVPRLRHQKHHHAGRCTEPMRDHLDRIRPQATAWHRSEEGRAWHRENGKRAWVGRESREMACTRCGATFKTRDSRDVVRFCSNTCKAAARRASGVDNEQRVCDACERAFCVNRYSKQRFCSRSCGAQARAA